MLLHVMALANASVPLDVDDSFVYYSFNFAQLWFDGEVLDVDGFFVSVPDWVEIAVDALDAEVFVGRVYSILDRCWSIVAV